MANESRASGLTVVGASAGTGKTYTLTTLVWDACRGGPGEEGRERPAIRPEGLIGVTFTEKAAAELVDRIRARLFAEGGADAAQRLPLAWLGTVHGVGLRIVREYAFEAGITPDPRVLPEDGERLLRMLLEHAVPAARRARLIALGRQLRIDYDPMRRRSEWDKAVFRLVQGARANRITPERLRAMWRRSWEGLGACLAPPDPGRDLDAELAAVARDLLTRGPAPGDGTSTTEKAFQSLRGALADLAVEPVWQAWATIAGIKAAKASDDRFAPLRALADAHLAHPGLHAALAEFLEEAFAAAADILESYADWKSEQRVLDWIDMLELALQALDSPEVSEDVARRMELVVVDELQDSQPLQVAIFARLHVLIGRSYWVGDPKQCIFDWSGADPGLVDGLLRQVALEGGRAERLSTNYRSRPGLVRLSSEVFARAFATIDMRAEDVVVEPCEARVTIEPELASLPPLGLARLAAGAKSSEKAEQLARIVAAILEVPERTPIVDRHTGRVRPVRAGDVALLLRDNKACRALARALASRGIRSSVAINGLLHTPEGRALLAALRLMVADDPTAEAELEALDGWAGYRRAGESALAGRARWLAERVAARAGGGARPGRGRWSEALDEVRAEVLGLSPSGVVDRVIDALGLIALVRGWGPGGAARVSNLDALRMLARQYEADAAGRASGATLSGLLRYLQARENHDDEQHVPEGDAELVTISTYHKAKGLEWPVVVLASLDDGARDHPFEVRPESDGLPRLEAPLADRWVRYWPWPHGRKRTGTLRDVAATSDVGRSVTERERRERLRLLYVGFTRARDHLVLAVPFKASGGRGKPTAHAPVAPWLALIDVGGPTFDFGASGAGVVRVRGRQETFELPCREWAARDVTFPTPETKVLVAPAGARGPRGRAPRRAAPSHLGAEELAALGGAGLEVGEIVQLGAQLDDLWLGASHNAEHAGLALHGFLAGDAERRKADARRRAARDWLAHYGVEASAEGAMIAAADRFWKWLERRFTKARRLTEVPVCARVGAPERVIGGSIDLLLETDEGLVVIDHKRGRHAGGVRAKAMEYAAQLAAYRLALEAAGERVRGTWVHLAEAGVVIELVRRAAAR